MNYGHVLSVSCNTTDYKGWFSREKKTHDFCWEISGIHEKNYLAQTSPIGWEID